MPNSASTIVFGGSAIKAWCLTGFNGPTNIGNFVNGYNLILDETLLTTQRNTFTLSQQGLSTGAIPFRFVTPMQNTKYKIFVQPRTNGSLYAENGRALFCHALNTTQYPKTRNGFWVRLGIMIRGNDNTGAGFDTFINDITNRPAVGEILNRSQAVGTYQLQVLVV
jgi:hypothetical protein